jgi:hypothetical protein
MRSGEAICKPLTSCFLVNLSDSVTYLLRGGVALRRID